MLESIISFDWQSVIAPAIGGALLILLTKVGNRILSMARYSISRASAARRVLWHWLRLWPARRLVLRTIDAGMSGLAAGLIDSFDAKNHAPSSDILSHLPSYSRWWMDDYLLLASITQLHKAGRILKKPQYEWGPYPAILIYYKFLPLGRQQFDAAQSECEIDAECELYGYVQSTRCDNPDRYERTTRSWTTESGYTTRYSASLQQDAPPCAECWKRPLIPKLLYQDKIQNLVTIDFECDIEGALGAFMADLRIVPESFIDSIIAACVATSCPSNVPFLKEVVGFALDLETPLEYDEMTQRMIDYIADRMAIDTTPQS